MEPWQFYLIISVQLLSGFISIILAILINKRNREYRGNKYLSLAFLLYSLYPFGSFFYELGINELIVQISIRISLIGSILGMGAFLISMSIFCLGSYSKNIKKFLLPGSIVTTLVCIIIIWPSSVTDVELNPTTSRRSIVLMGAISAYIFLTTSRMIYLLTGTINEIKLKNPEISDRLSTFRISLLISLGIILFSLIENITRIHFFNIFTYIFLLLFFIFISQPLLKKKIA